MGCFEAIRHQGRPRQIDPQRGLCNVAISVEHGNAGDEPDTLTLLIPQ